jgi:hypothetical protein
MPPLDEMLHFGGDGPDRKKVSFRLTGPALDPDAITRAIGLTPSRSHRKGEARPHPSAGRTPPPWREGLWSLCSEQGLSETGNHLEDHVVWLLDQLEPHAETLRRLSAEQGLRADVYCSYFMGQANSGFELTARTVARIAALDADFGVDIYGENIELELETWLKNAPPEG